MTTQIFTNIKEFWNREDKTINGVTQEFANNNPDWDKERANESCWNCSGCSDCSRCFCCSDCSRCYGCSGCSGCYGCSGCSGLENNAPIKLPETPIIPNIHVAVLQAIEKEGQSLNMSNWHTCDRTHCRAGWVVTLAGEDGRKLEELTSTAHAAMQIYHKSCPEISVSPVRFYEDNKTAMRDIIRCAEAQKALK